MPALVPFAGASEPLAAGSHMVAAAVAILFAPALVSAGGNRTAARAAITVFAVALVLLFGVSGAYHVFDLDGAPRAVLRRIDHALIWILIAATFTPVHVIAFRGAARWVPLACIWFLAITGLVLKTIYFTEFPEGLGFVLYIGFGWMGFFAGIKLYRSGASRAVGLILAGGVAYTTGAVLSAFHWPTPVPGLFGHHEIFHLAVCAGAALHWQAVATLCLAGDPVPADEPA